MSNTYLFVYYKVERDNQLYCTKVYEKDFGNFTRYLQTFYGTVYVIYVGHRMIKHSIYERDIGFVTKEKTNGNK